MFTAAPATNQLAQDLNRLGRMVRTAPRFIDAVRWWAGFPLRAEIASPADAECLTESAAVLLDLPPGTIVLRRETHLVASMGGPHVIAASVTELVHEPLLGADLAARRALRDGARPVDAVLDGLHRAVYLLTRPSADTGDDEPALVSHAILSAAGRPVALTTETVHRGLLTHRAPDTIPHYAARVPAAEVAP